MKKLFKTSQVDPSMVGGMEQPPADPMAAAPAPSLAGAMPGTMPAPMGLPGDTPLGLPTDPMAAPAPVPSAERQEIIGPINSIAQILYDMDVAKYIQNNLHLNEKELALKVWSEYGGNDDGTVDEAKAGNRTKENLTFSPEDAGKERESTENSKWERLEKNKTIADIISYEDLGKIIKGLIYGVVLKTSTQAATPPGGAGAGGGLFAANKARIIIAKALESQYLFKQTDAIINDILKNTPK